MITYQDQRLLEMKKSTYVIRRRADKSYSLDFTLFNCFGSQDHKTLKEVFETIERLETPVSRTSITSNNWTHSNGSL